jgi:hypothetical protein
VPISPERYAETGVYELLQQAARGHVAFDRRLIQAILGRGGDPVPDLVRFASEDRSADRVDISLDLIRLFAARPTPEALPFLISEIERFPEDVPDEMAEAVVRIGEPAIDALIETAEPVEDIGFLLAVLGIRDNRIAAFLRRLLAEDPAEGAFLCGLYGDPALKPDLEAARESAPEAVDEALDQLQAEAPKPLEPFDIEGEYPEEIAPDVEDLPEAEQEEFLASDSAELRAAGVGALANRELSGKQVDRLFALAIADPDERVRGMAWEALRNETGQDRIRQAARARLEDASLGIVERAGLAIALSSLEDPEYLAPHIEAVYVERPVRAKALEAVWRTESRLFEPLVVPHLDDPDPSVREEAIYCAGFLGLRGELKTLEAMFNDPDFRDDALFAWMLAAPGADNRVGMKQLRARAEQLAGELSEEEQEIVEAAIQVRMQRAGRDVEPVPGEAAPKPKVGRNEPCPCGSGRKYKKCCGA